MGVNAICLFLFYGFFKLNLAFFPLKIESQLLTAINLNNRLDEVSLTISHEEIIRKGITKSVVNYFNAKASRTNNNKLFKRIVYNPDDSLEDVFFKFYGRHFCMNGLNSLIEHIFEKNVAIVDLAPETKDLAEAHFDSESLNQANQRVIHFTDEIIDSIENDDYDKARKLSGQILHTIQDFYSHSNWIEMGNNKIINKLIGTPEFETKQNIIKPKDRNVCASNCKEITVECDSFYNVLLKVFSENNLGIPIATCPFKYYKCEKNVIISNKLLSGYVDGSTREDGTVILKPIGSMKCSHGGIIDKSSFTPAKGGINKDSGFYVFSPHANRHLNAANLAIEHTAFFFDKIRDKIGDKNFAKLLRLDPSKETLNKMCDLFGSVGKK